MIDKYDNFYKVFNIFTIIFVIIGFLGFCFIILNATWLHLVNIFLKDYLFYAVGFLFGCVGMGSYISILYLLLRYLQRFKFCYIQEYFTVSYIEIEGRGIFEKYFPIFENQLGREMVSKYFYLKDSFMVGEKVEILWNSDKTEYIIRKFNYIGLFLLFILVSLFMSWLGFSFCINKHTFLFVLFLIILTLLIFLCDTIQTIITNKNR